MTEPAKAADRVRQFAQAQARRAAEEAAEQMFGRARRELEELAGRLKEAQEEGAQAAEARIAEAEARIAALRESIETRMVYFDAQFAAFDTLGDSEAVTQGALSVQADGPIAIPALEPQTSTDAIADHEHIIQELLRRVAKLETERIHWVAPAPAPAPVPAPPAEPSYGLTGQLVARDYSVDALRLVLYEVLCRLAGTQAALQLAVKLLGDGGVLGAPALTMITDIAASAQSAEHERACESVGLDPSEVDDEPAA